MDEYSMRKAPAELSFSRKASSRLVLRDSADTRDRNNQLCNRAGCSSRMNVNKTNQIGYSGKVKSTRHPFHLSSSGKEVVASSSRTPLPLNNPRKPSPDLRRKSPCSQAADTSTASLSQEFEASEAVMKPDNAQIRLSTAVQDNVSGEAGSSASINPSRHGKKTIKRPELGTDETLTGTSTSRELRNSNDGVRNGAITTKYDFRNFNCNSVNDVASSSTSLASASSSSLDTTPDGKRAVNRKRIGEAEASLPVRGKKINGTPLDGRTIDRGISISSSRRTRNSTFTMDNAATPPFLTQRATDRRGRVSEQEDGNRIRQSESLSSIPVLPLPSIPAGTDTTSSLEYQFPSQGSSSSSSGVTNAFRRLGSNRANASSNRSLAPFDVGIGSSFMFRENVSQYSLDGIAEMLLALGRFDQDEELSHERMLLMETNLFLSGLSFSDQHRDMRLDIDNMSYEELLALGERIGTVSTALTEEALEKSIKKCFYHATAGITSGEDDGDDDDDDDEKKCSICQEEYEEGSEMGRLGCEHEFHLECIEQWLHLKNWCPFCKASALPPSPPPVL